MDCELCKSQIPGKNYSNLEQIKIKNEYFTVLKFDAPTDTNYISFENIRKDKRDKRYIYIIHIGDKDCIYIVILSLIKGRSNSSDITLSDTSVSKNHAIIKLIKGCLYLNDNNSKFGTLAQIQSEILLIPYKRLDFQDKNTIYSFIVRKKFLAYFKCVW